MSRQFALHRSRFPNMGTNIFTLMNELTLKYSAINLAQGFPNFEPPEPLLELAQQALREGRNQYAPMPGLPSLREAIAEKIATLYDYQLNPADEITVTPGGHAALMAALSAVLFPGDEAIIFDPSFDCFAPIVTLTGAKPVFVTLEGREYSIPWDKLQASITPKTKAIVLNTPHNPTATTLSADDMERIADLVEGTDITIVSDEVYEHIVYDGEPHQSICRFPRLRERAFGIYSFGKVFHATGWKIGYAIAPSPLMAEFRKVYQMMTFTTNHPLQWALTEILKAPDHYLELSSFYQRKRDLFLERLSSSKFSFTPAAGSYFQCLCYEEIFDLPEMEAAEMIMKEVQVSSIPVSAFHHDGTDRKMLRFCFAKTEDVLQEAAEALCRL